MPVDRQAVADALAQANAQTGLFSAKSPKIEREMGHYWVRYGDGQPEIAVWDDGQWWCVGDDGGYPPERIVVLSPRLTPPAPGAAAPEPTPVPRVRVRWGVPVGGDDAPNWDAR